MWRVFAPTVAIFSTFLVASFTVPANARRVDEFVLVAIVGLIVAAGRFGGRGSALYAALMGALSFDFFHVEPVRVLHARTLAVAALAFGAVAIATARRVAVSEAPSR